MTTAGPQDQPSHHFDPAGRPYAAATAAAAAVVTACGRRIAVAPLCIGAAGGPFARVALDVGPERGGASRAWAGLSPQEARGLAFLLLEQAARAEQLAGPGA